MGWREALTALIGNKTTVDETAWSWGHFERVAGMSAEELYRTQPHLRTVISFRARNVAHLSLQMFERVNDTDRRRVTDDPAIRLLRNPNPDMTGYELIESLVSDYDLYDAAYWFVYESAESPTGWIIRPLSPAWLNETKGGVFSPKTYVFQVNDKLVPIPAEQLLVFHGFNPGKPKKGSTKIEALKAVLEEQIQAWEFRQQVWARGGRVGSYLTRPAGTSEWSGEARQRFQRAWSEFSGSGGKAGQTPVLEDGMELKRVGFSAKEDEWLEGAKLSLATVASIYHVNPVMVGILDNANFSNTKEFRKMLYSDTLGPLLSMIQDRLNTFFLPRISGRDDVYFEFNIQSKLAGDFEEQAKVLQSSTGGPWMTRNEARARQNLPAIDGGDDLIVPLNVVIGGQASPQDSGTQNQNSGSVRLKALRKGRALVKAADAVTDGYVEAAAAVFTKFYERQARAVMSVLGEKSSADWWDGARWDRELAADLHELAVRVADEVGRDQAVALGFEPGSYDTDRTAAFLEAVALDRAKAVNATTHARVEKALADGANPASVFDEALSARVGSGATALVAALAGFATVEAARQLVADRGPTKTWVVNSTNPRSAHAAMKGETVGIDDRFSNGADWPGEFSLGASQSANCQCSVDIEFEV